MKFCSCGNPSFGKDKLTNIPYCRSCQHKRTDLDKRSIIVKAIEKQKRLENKVRSLPHASIDEISRNQIIADLDTVVSLYVRIRAANELGICQCYTCGVKRHYTKMQNGHFQKRGNMALRFDTKYNCNVQCKTCNETLDGNYEVYKANLEKEYPGITEQLEEQAREVYKIGIDELSQMLIDYRAKLRIVESKLKIKV